MRHFFILSAVYCISAFSLCANAQNSQAEQVKNNNMDQPYKMDANNITIGDMAYAQKVLRAWKDFDNNTLDNSADLFADDVVATFPDGSMVKGKENLMKSAKEYRNSFSAVSSQVNACTTLKTPDDPEHEVVTIWGVETDTKKDGTTIKTHLNEVWFFNKAGKVTELHQMAAKDALPQK
jgi:hypothetical protein